MKASKPAAQRTTLLWAAVFVVAVAGCTSEPETLPEPADVETCDDVVDVGAQLAGVWVDVVEQLPVDQLLAETPPAEFAELAAIGRELDERAARLGCDAAQVNVEIRARLAGDEGIDPEGPVAQMLLDLVQGGVVAELPPAPTTTVAPTTGG